MTSEIKNLTDSDIDGFIRQTSVFVLFRYVIAAGIFSFALVGALKNFSFDTTSVFITFAILMLAILFIAKLVNAIKWILMVRKDNRQLRQVSLQVFVSNSHLGPFSDLQVTLHDCRNFKSFFEFYKPKWRLVGSNWNAKKLIGEAQNCIAYADHDSGKIYAFAFTDGILFPKPYFAPWCKIDVDKMIRQNTEERSLEK